MNHNIKDSMPKKLLITIFLLIALHFFSCRAGRNLSKDEQIDDMTAIETILDNVGISPEQNEPELPYHESAKREWDLLHTHLKVTPVWENETLKGQAYLQLKPWFNPKKELVLDAKGFILNKVAIFNDGEYWDQKYHYDNYRLTIHLDREYKQDEKITVFIDYTARPSGLDSLLDGGDANEKGLYFINSGGKTEGKPRQIWTQGETNGSPAWFPTIDQPNERCTQETVITVDKKYTTLSNGLLVNSIENANGTRTDHWKMSLPHAPYLFMMAIGEFSVTRDYWRGKEVSYFLEAAYAPYARDIFGNTPEMLEFFSQILGTEYPWEKYAQVVVRDFVSGAMENTTATVHFEAVQRDKVELIDGNMEDFISHELFHQWFGDLVTCESWSNLTLNEGFATYGEYLWKEHKYGKDDADESLIGKRWAYFGEAKRKKEPLIRYHYDDPDDLFDAHSYQKGGLVLHMLRKYLGDEAFFASLRHYLSKNAFSDVEADELRNAFEEISGQDLKWFFDQWFFTPGHPELSIEHIDSAGGYFLNIKQVQDLQKYPFFRLPFDVRLMFADGTENLVRLELKSQDSLFSIHSDKKVMNVSIDPDLSFLAFILEEKPRDKWEYQASHAKSFHEKSAALEHLTENINESSVFKLVLGFTSDPYWGMRQLALDILAESFKDGKIPGSGLPRLTQRCLEMSSDPRPAVRASAIALLKNAAERVATEQGQETVGKIVTRLVGAVGDSSMNVKENAIRALYQYDRKLAIEKAQSMEKTATKSLGSSIAAIYKMEKMPEAMSYIKALYARERSPRYRAPLVRDLMSYLSGQDENIRNEGIGFLKEVASNDNTWWVRWSALQEIGTLANEPGTKLFFEERLKLEEHEFLKEYLNNELKKQ